MPNSTHFICPICKKPLCDNEKSLVCENAHCFDKAKSGYINLLPANKMHTKHPGDNKQMVQKRTEFLSKDYYKKLKDSLSIQIVKLTENIGEKDSSLFLLDVGCGEGYYTAAIKEKIPSADICGIDISKEALKAACRRDKAISYAVASVFDLPVQCNSVDILTELFAPFEGKEFYRVLKKDGILLLVIPNENHLFGMKKAIYDNPYKNEVKNLEIEGFSLIDKISINDEIYIDNQADIQSLFLMTPYSYKTSIEDTQRLMQLKSLKTEIEFLILCYKKL